MIIRNSIDEIDYKTHGEVSLQKSNQSFISIMESDLEATAENGGTILFWAKSNPNIILITTDEKMCNKLTRNKNKAVLEEKRNCVLC